MVVLCLKFLLNGFSVVEAIYTSNTDLRQVSPFRDV